MEGSSIIKLATSLDQGGPAQVPQRLYDLWKSLTSSSVGGFHTAEKVILRWLLKTMNGPTPDAEKVRRNPLTWAIMSCVLGRIPLFSLAKALADRRFISVLQQTVKDLSKPSKSPVPGRAAPLEDSETETASGISLKRKRTPEVSETSLDLGTLRSPQGCVRSAAPLFETLRVLLSRIASGKHLEPRSSDKIGAEHIKSLFCTPAAEAIKILAPLLRICELALVHQESDPAENQASWIATAAAIWNLHLQGSHDALEVATHLSRTAVLMSGELLGIGQPAGSALPPAVRTFWLRDLKDLMAKSFILPARSDFLNRKGTEVISTPVRLGNVPGRTLSTVLFLLALGAPPAIGGISTKRDNEAWLDAVFSLLSQPLKSVGTKQRNKVVAEMLSLTLEHHSTLPLATLRSICRDFARDGDSFDWSLVCAVARCEPDVFLLSEEGTTLLNELLSRAPHSKSLDGSLYDSLRSLMLSLADGFVRARDMPRYIRQWFDNLVDCRITNRTDSTLGVFWVDGEIRRKVSAALQESLTARQLADLVRDLGRPEGPSAEAARAIVYDALSQGMTDEDFVDGAGPSLFEQVWTSPATFVASEVLSARWRTATRAVAWGLGNQLAAPGCQVAKSLRHTLGSSPISGLETFEAFRCGVAAWNSHRHAAGGSPSEPEATLGLFLDRLGATLGDEGLREDDLSRFWLGEARGQNAIDLLRTPPLGVHQVSATTYFVWIVVAYPRSAGLLEASALACSALCRAILDSPAATSELGIALSQGLLDHMAGFSSSRLSSLFIGQAIDALSGRSEDQTADARLKETAVRVLMKVPSGCLSRGDRERCVAGLLDCMQGLSGSMEEIRMLELALGLMTQIMRRPTFYPNMSFHDLLRLGETVEKLTIGTTGEDGAAVDTARGHAIFPIFHLFRELANLTMRQMAASCEPREVAYLNEVFPAICEQSRTGRRKKSEDHPQHCFVALTLFSALITALKQSPTSEKTSQKVKDLDKIESELSRLMIAAFQREFGVAAHFQGQDLGNGGRNFVDLWAALLASESHWDRSVEKSIAPLRAAMISAGKSIPSDNFGVRALFSQFLLTRFGHTELKGQEPLDLVVKPWAVDGDVGLGGDGGSATLDRLRALQNVCGKSGILCEDAKARATLFRDLAEQASRGERLSSGQILAIRQVLRCLNVTGPPSSLDEGDMSVSMIQGTLTQRLVRSESVGDFFDAARTIHRMLDGKSQSVSQWNVEHTLSSVVLLCSLDASSGEGAALLSPKKYVWLCRLTEVILKRHRRRLEGHLHLLVAVLQSLLTCLVGRPRASSSAAANTTSHPSHQQWEEQAALYCRLLTLVCEPSAASVMRPQHNALDSATDAAKRSAGQHMYLVLVHFVRLQLEGEVPHGVREALIPGIYSILDITPPELCKIMVDAMDASGRAIWKDLYNKYRKFGKWKGA